MEFIAEIDQLRHILKWIRKELAQMDFDSSRMNKIELASEEALVNIMRYAYQGKSEKIDVEVRSVPKSHAEIVFKDHGPPFNPLEAKELDLSSTLEERETGGLGIYLIRAIMDEVRYLREGGQNVLTLIIRSSRRK